MAKKRVQRQQPEKTPQRSPSGKPDSFSEKNNGCDRRFATSPIPPKKKK